MVWVGFIPSVEGPRRTKGRLPQALWSPAGVFGLELPQAPPGSAAAAFGLKLQGFLRLQPSGLPCSACTSQVGTIMETEVCSANTPMHTHAHHWFVPLDCSNSLTKAEVTQVSKMRARGWL